MTWQLLNSSDFFIPLSSSFEASASLASLIETEVMHIERKCQKAKIRPPLSTAKKKGRGGYRW